MYSPAEDSWMFAEFLEEYFCKLKNKNISYLDMGCGSAILAESVKKCGVKNILCADIDEEAVKFAKKKGFCAIRSNLFSNIDEKFDVISFNAPYLPEDEDEPEDSKLQTTGGKRGDEIPLEFVRQAKKHLNKNGKIFLLISSLTPFDKIKKFNPRIVARKKIFFEELLIIEIE